MNMAAHAKTKIVCTIGPASWEEDVLKALIDQGMNVARINASFADAKELGFVADRVRAISNTTAIALDLMGHKIRVTGFDTDKAIEEGQQITLIPQTTVAMPDHVIQTTYPNLAKFVHAGVQILIDDGNLVLEVKHVKGKEVVCKVKIGGILKKRKTVNVPNVHLEFPALTEKDANDIKFGIDSNVDYIFGSFIRNKQDVMMIREAMGKSDTKFIAKIEDWEGVEKFDEILEVVDGVMVARGDMGVELPLEDVPIIQKMMIQKCRNAGKLVIVATQMLESMKENPRPTRAETNDVANSVMDGTDAVMLSAESSVGKYPVLTVETMNRIALAAEAAVRPSPVNGRTRASHETDILCASISQYVDALDLKAVIVLSKTGKTIESLSRHRIKVPIYNISSNPKLIRQYNAFRGVEGIYLDKVADDRDKITSQAMEKVYSLGLLNLKDKVAIISGSSIKNKSLNSILEIAQVKDILQK